ncbi:hypothetical protein fugu_014969 [Takifugu bimaculatus]|uniref:Uncharacterized protein n=1 Tax=Takifugu bimaculatus TaxID=433685 RepID=A0A4Z2BXA8_9TELE|nr:hypothetical protein fugu_014969 [Takifugu bimaculatus]
MSLPEEDLMCPVCYEIFTDPMLLPCSHSFCRGCLKRCWDTGLRECPVCRKKVNKSSASSNLALKNVCEAVMQVKKEKLNCNLHGEKLKLFCVIDKEPICVVCQTSRRHKTHDCLPVGEAVQECKDELSSYLNTLQDKLETLNRNYTSCTGMVQYIKEQSVQTQTMIKDQFGQLHEVLHQEESKRIASVKREEETRITEIKEKIKGLSGEVQTLKESISVIQGQLKEDDMLLLKNFKDARNRGESTALGSDDMSGLLLDVTKHLCNLKYRIWEKMLDDIGYTPVTLDPNTAHPCLILSGELTSLHYKKESQHCPDNPERFHMSAEVVGMTALGSGSHQWVVETGSNQDWLLGVASLSVSRKVAVSARPENGYLALCFRDGEFRAMTSPPSLVDMTRKPKQIRVHLDFNKGRLSFSDPKDEKLIYEFTHTFKEPVLPYFYTQSSFPLRIMPEKVLVTMLRQ